MYGYLCILCVAWVNLRLLKTYSRVSLRWEAYLCQLGMAERDGANASTRTIYLDTYQLLVKQGCHSSHKKKTFQYEIFWSDLG